MGREAGRDRAIPLDRGWRVRAAGAFFGLGTGALVGAILLAAARPESPSARVMRLIFSRACHQRPERSFAWAGEPFCVCHRCFGIYTGIAIGALIASILPRIPIDPGSRRLWALAVVPMLVHVALLNLWSPADVTLLRVGTGALFGLLGGFASAVALGTALEPPAASRPPRLVEPPRIDATPLPHPERT